MKKTLLFTLLLISFFACKTKDVPRGPIADHAMVVSAREEASEIGLEILKKGGNAFDAMIATKFALAVSFPFAGNIGGGGFLVYRLRDGTTGTLDFREKAPLAATKQMYLDSLGEVIAGKSTTGASAVGVPGSVAGMFAAHKKFGTLPFNTLIQPAIDLAKKGVVVTQKQANSLNYYRDKIVEVSGDTILFANQFVAKDTIKYQSLARTLELIRDHGQAGFYQGEIAEKIVDFIKFNGGIISLKDLKQYQAIWRDAVEFKYKDLKIISMGPPSSGGITLAQIMKMVAPYSIGDFSHNGTEHIQLLTEAQRRAYADRAYFLGDPDFVHVPQHQLIDQEYLRKRMKSFSFDTATSSSDVGHGAIEILEHDQTTHFSIVDPMGNAIAVTTTINGAYGSKLYSEELGFFFNNEMDDFSVKPGTPNMFGLTGGQANSIAPEKRMLSSMTPTIVEKDGALSMTLGTPGGSTIITSVAQTMLNVYEFDMGMQQAVDAPRFHHQWLPDEVLMEPNGFDSLTIQTLKNKGYKIKHGQSRIIGKVDGIYVLPDGRLEGGADRRGDDTAVGF
ncbi:gamma-glutamyltransferase [Galbibacter marinus]|uniref:Glutathione hydrolase proenzyme n=1 Tax=Galbibacter marinus TaxID=555500 RepID=K2P165_9FLAO|nr:gamma-glutamyltransferase [Galbibacter marinus]EKF54748.1 gamma-glutamyltransferase [Galbibacter marinus]